MYLNIDDEEQKQTNETYSDGSQIMTLLEWLQNSEKSVNERKIAVIWMNFLDVKHVLHGFILYHQLEGNWLRYFHLG
jgi:hypothetical protein